MSKCENCIHYEACKDWTSWIVDSCIFPYACEGDEKPCDFYKDKSLFGEIKTRCKDCVYCYHNEANRTYRCLFYKAIMRPDDFCSWGIKEGTDNEAERDT